jgi:hypothetical protein
MAEFGVRDVAAAFNAIHDFLQSCNNGPAAGRVERIRRRIIAGDWLDLPRLTVRGDSGGDAFDGANKNLGAHGALLRLIVVGIDSFTKTNAGAPAHVVFQFLNVPTMHRMNPGDTNAGGYAQSEMRRYLTGNFLAGLTVAGIPESAIYAPTRYIANGGENARGADALADKVWLPTEREIFGDRKHSHERYETAENQARLEYYDSDVKRVKYNSDNDSWWWYWLASPSSGSAFIFCIAYNSGRAGTNSASYVGGCAPAFCVR